MLFAVIPWLVHGIQSIDRKTYLISQIKSSITLAFFWIPWSSHGMTMQNLNYSIRSPRNKYLNGDQGIDKPLTRTAMITFKLKIIF
ncbi:MAG: hypothetical protein ACRYE8_02520 [Janthinobacterium lividum]